MRSLPVDALTELATVWYWPEAPNLQPQGPDLSPGSQPSPPVPPAPTALATPGCLVAGRYRLDQPLGAGAFATVHAAWDLALHRWVAVKLTPLGSPGAGGSLGPAEARLQATCQHPNLMPVHDAGADPLLGCHFLVMPLYPGADLAATLSRFGPLPFRAALLCVDQIASALDFLWQQRQAIHGDLKPANLWLTRSGAALLMDFNLQGLLVRGAARVGTPGYRAPEALRGDLDPRSDVFSLGCVLYECLAGAPPFRSDEEVLRGRYTSLRRLRPGVHPTLEAAVRTALAADPTRRFQSAREFQTALRSHRRRGAWGWCWRRSGPGVRRGLSALHRELWRWLRYALRHPLQALVEALVLAVLARWAWAALVLWLHTHRLAAAATLAAGVALLLLTHGRPRRW